jgi:hypothetical protein
MIKDPLTEWSGLFPYDGLAGSGCGPNSSMREIQEAPFSLIESGQWSAERRAAWDELRFVDRRMWVDFLMYAVSESEIEAQMTNVAEELYGEREIAEPAGLPSVLEILAEVRFEE